MNRRDFVQNGMMSAVGSRLISTMILQMLVEGRYSQAFAQQSQIPPRRLLDLSLRGGAPGWFFHLPLNPFTTDYVHNISAANYFEGGAPVYKTTLIQKAGQAFRMPHLWSAAIPTASQGPVPLSNLMDNMLILRGFTHPRDGHSLCMHEVFRPDPNQRSLHGIISDSSDPKSIPIPAVSIDHYSAETYHSHSVGIKVLTPYDYPGAFSNLLKPFSADTAMKSLLARKDQFSSAFDAAMLALKQDAERTNRKNDAAFAAVASAETLLKRDFGNLTEAFTSLRNKYVALISGCTNISQVLNQTVSPESGSIWRRYGITGDLNNLAPNPDLRTMITAGSQVFMLAEVCATAEFLLTNNLSSAILGGIGSSTNLQIDGLVNGSGQPVLTSFGWDQHFTGVALSVVSNTFAFHAIAACIYELVRVLKQNNQFDETVIRLSSEFSRSPRDTGSNQSSPSWDPGGSGSDHGFLGNHFAVFSGAIKKPAILGNILIDASSQHPYSWSGFNGVYKGSWGVGSKVPTIGGSTFNQKLTWNHAASTMASMLRIPSPVPSSRSVVAESSTEGIVPLIEDGRNTES